jgi:hypothetical protein
MQALITPLSSLWVSMEKVCSSNLWETEGACTLAQITEKP